MTRHFNAVDRAMLEAHQQDTARERGIADVLRAFHRLKQIYGADFIFAYDLVKAEALIQRERDAIQQRWN